MSEEVTDKMLFIGLRKDIKVMECKERHGTITKGERVFLKAWKKQLAKALDNAPDALRWKSGRLSGKCGGLD